MAHLKAAKDTVKVKVEARLPQDYNRVQIERFVCIYKNPSRDEAERMARDIMDGVRTEHDVLKEHVVGWEELKDVNEEPVPFDEENFEEALSLLPYAKAMGKGLWKLINGFEDARTKNSSRRG